jgi:hypothetical protein
MLENRSPPIEPSLPTWLFRTAAHARRNPGLQMAPADLPRVTGPRNSTRQRPGRKLLEFCRDRRDDVLRFAGDTSIWPVSNISERGVRPRTTQQKISGRLSSDDVTRNRLGIRSYIDTARKHGKNAARYRTPPYHHAQMG